MGALSQAAIAPTPLDSERMHAVCERLPPFPPLAAQLMRLFSSPDASLQDAAVLIRSDAVFSGELLKLANSAEFASYEPLEDVSRAVLYLGFDRVQGAIRRITYGRLLNDAFSHAFAAEIHRNNIATAYLCEYLTRGLGLEEAAEQFCPYTVGLYLKIGALVLLRGFPRDYPRFLRTAVRGEADLLETERVLFGFNHVEISCHLARYWGFPEELQTLITRHCRQPEAGERSTLEEVAHIASHMAGALGYSFLKSLDFEPLEALAIPWMKHLPEGFPTRPDEWKTRINAHLKELSMAS